MSYTDEPQVLTMIANMLEKTGKPLEEWFAVLGASGFEKHGQMMKLLKGEHEVSHGYANTIVVIYRQQAAGGAPKDDDLVAAQYEGTKAALKPIYEAVIASTSNFGSDNEVASIEPYGDGTLWIGTYRGLDYLVPTVFESYDQSANGNLRSVVAIDGAD